MKKLIRQIICNHMVATGLVLKICVRTNNHVLSDIKLTYITLMIKIVQVHNEAIKLYHQHADMKAYCTTFYTIAGTQRGKLVAIGQWPLECYPFKHL